MISAFWKYLKMNRTPYLFIAPFMILFSVFTLIPVIASMILSFSYYNILEAPKMVGWANYVKLFFSDDIFLIAVKNTFIFAAITGPVSYVACLLLAWLINDFSPRIRAFLTLVFYAPSISGAVYMIWSIIFSADSYGYLNSSLMKLGIIREPILWLHDPQYILGVIILVQIWLSLGTSFLAFIAGLQSIDHRLYEAGAMDGIRNRWQELWYITLPSMKPQLMFGAVIQITVSFAVNEVSTNLAGFPSVDYAAHTIVTHLIDYGNIRFELGYASAIATILFITMVSTNKIVHNLIKKIGD